MPSFNDQAGRTWNVRITNLSIRDVKARHGLDLRELLNDECRPLLELISDSLKLSEVLYTICREQAIEQGVTVDHFLDAFYGDVSSRQAKLFVMRLSIFSRIPSYDKRSTMCWG